MGVIAAVLDKSSSTNPEVIQAMLSASRHYGGEQLAEVSGRCAIGIRNGTRVADTQLAKHGQWIAAFSGKLDNHEELKTSLIQRGHTLPTNSSAELVLMLMRESPPDTRASVPAQLRGVFAVIVSDGNEIWCFRDQLGWRPLHFHEHSTRFVVASEARQVIVGAGLSKEPDLAVVEAMFYSRLTKTTPSVWKGVERLPQATLLHVTPSTRPTQRGYWDLASIVDSATFPDEEVADRFSSVFQKAVERCLTGKDVISLSGGIDSPAVAAFAAPHFRKQWGRPMPALSTVYPEYPRVDESGYIKLIASFLGMELHTFSPKAGPWDNLPHWNDVLDGPTPTLAFDEVHEYNTLAYELGFRNVIGGDIAEAVFNLNKHVIGHLVTRGRWKALVNMWQAVHSQGTTPAQFAMFMASPFIPGDLANWYLRRTGRDFPQRITEWLIAEKVNEVPFRRDLLRPARERYTGIQLHPFQGTTLTLEAGEIVAQLSGVTTRSPFADVDLLEFFIALPAEIKFPDLGSKTLMRRMLRGRLPDAILDRKDKTVFSDYVLSHLNYDVLRQYLINPSVRVAGVDYAKLAERIERKDFKLIDYAWANDLVRIHIFLSQW